MVDTIPLVLGGYTNFPMALMVATEPHGVWGNGKGELQLAQVDAPALRAWHAAEDSEVRGPRFSRVPMSVSQNGCGSQLNH